MLSSFGAILLLVGLAQWLFFPNINKNFDPDVFIYIYGAFGVIMWFLFKVKRIRSINDVLKLFILTRLAILAIQALFFYLGGFYNQRNEVNYYQELAGMILNRDSGIFWRDIMYGMPPGYQFWLVAYDLLVFNTPVNILRDLAFSSLNVAFEFGTMFVLTKMHGSKSFQTFSMNNKEESKEQFEFGILFYAASIFNLYFSNVRNFMDAIPIFLGILGLYFHMQNRHAMSALLLSISTLIKFVPIFWLLLIILKFLKKRDIKTAFSYIFVAAMTAGAGFLLSSWYFQENPITYFFEFLDQFSQWSTRAGDYLQLNQAFWFTVYDSAFFIAGLTAIVALAFFFVWKEDGGPTIHAFTSIISVYFVFQPWYDQRYVIWILPLLCLDLLSSKKNFATIITLFYVSIFIYLLFMHFPNNLAIDTRVTSPTPLVGNLYRLTGQFISYAGFLLVPILHVKQLLSKQKSKLPHIHGTGGSGGR